MKKERDYTERDNSPELDTLSDAERLERWKATQATLMIDLPPRGEIIQWRTANDGLNDMASDASGIMFDPEDHKARQEMGPETDIAWILNHHGVSMGRRTPQYPDIDFSIDLQKAIELQRELDSANIVAPAELKEKYPNKYAILAGIESGQYATDLQNLERELATKRHQEEVRKQGDQGPPPAPLTQPKPTE